MFYIHVLEITAGQESIIIKPWLFKKCYNLSGSTFQEYLDNKRKLFFKNIIDFTDKESPCIHFHYTTYD